MILLLPLIHSCKKDKTTLPVLTTTSASAISYTSATSGGNVTDEGGDPILSRGICWNTSPNPTINNSKTTESGTTGIFTSYLTSLTPNTLYYIRAYAYNKAGIGYGNQVSFTTSSPRLATLTTTEVIYIASIYAVSGGTLTDDGGGINKIGICWNISGNPTIADKSTLQYLYEPGSFTSDLTGLSANTTYYVRAYATNSSGTAYGNQVIFTTTAGQIIFNPGLTYGTVSDIDGNIYKTIQIGTQTWMAEDLKTTRYSDGTAIQLTSGDSAWDTLTTRSKSYCYYNDNINSTSSFGALYTWAAAMNGAASSSVSPSGVQGVCPTGWHLPSDAEWTDLTTYLGGTDIAGGKLKEAGNSHWYMPNTGATNESGFTGLPGGSRFGYGLSYGNAFFSFWWSSTDYSSDNAWIIGLSTFGKETGKYFGYEKKSGYSVRCVKD